MLEHRTVSAAARALGISRPAMRRVMAKPQTQQLLEEARHAVAREASKRIAGMFARGMKAIDDLLSSSKDERTRLAAAKIAVELGVAGPLALPITHDGNPGGAPD